MKMANGEERKLALLPIPKIKLGEPTHLKVAQVPYANKYFHYPSSFLTFCKFPVE
jgi:hypothetical protein